MNRPRRFPFALLRLWLRARGGLAAGCGVLATLAWACVPGTWACWWAWGLAVVAMWLSGE